MKILTILTILILAVFLTGCAAKEIGVAKEAEAEAKEHQRQVEEAAKQTESTRQQMEASVDDDEPEKETEGIKFTTKDGGSTTFNKLEDYRRDRDTIEQCDFDFPFECSDSLAKSGVLYITIKNQDYGSKVNELTLYMDGDMCDPADTFIEPGQNKDFECYPSISKGDLVQSDFEIEYYRPIGKTHLTKTGKVVIMME